MNISGALGVLFTWISSKPDNPHEALAALRIINRVLDVAPMEHADELENKVDSSDSEEFDVKAMCRGIDDARTNKDYARADELRTKLQEAGYEVRNSPEGTVATKQLA